MGVTAIYELPVQIWVMCDALGATYSTGYADIRFTVVMPHDHPPVGLPPSLPAIMSRQGSEAGEGVWAREYGAFIPESRRPATALHRVAVTEVEGPNYEHLPWFTAEHQLAKYIGTWFDQVRTWTEILTGQDLDPNHRVYDAESVGAGLEFVEPAHDGALGLTITTPHVVPLLAREWATILKFVRDRKEPPLEEILSRDARASHRRDADRRSVVEAATALEIALGRHVRGLSAQLPDSQQKRITARTALGDYISIAEQSGLQLAVPIDRLRWVNQLRNDAAHRGTAPSHWDAGEAVQATIDLLSAHGRYRRTGERELDGSEWVLLDLGSDTVSDAEPRSRRTERRPHGEPTTMPSGEAGGLGSVASRT